MQILFISTFTYIYICMCGNERYNLAIGFVRSRSDNFSSVLRTVARPVLHRGL